MNHTKRKDFNYVQRNRKYTAKQYQQKNKYLHVRERLATVETSGKHGASVTERIYSRSYSAGLGTPNRRKGEADMTDELSKNPPRKERINKLAENPEAVLAELNQNADKEQAKQQAAKEQLAELDNAGALFDFGVLDALHIKPLNWLVDGFLPEQSITIVYGNPKSGKSYVMQNLALSMATGEPWLGMRTMSNNSSDSMVLWIDLDMGHYGAMRRVCEETQGLCENFEINSPGLFDRFRLITPATFAGRDTPRLNFFDNQSVNALEAYIKNKNVSVCFIDTLSKITGNANENSADDMTKVFDRIKQVRDETGCSFVIIHHATKKNLNSQQSARGSSVIYAEPDLVLKIEKDKDNPSDLTLTVEDSRYTETDKFGITQEWITRINNDGLEMLDGNERRVFKYQIKPREINDKLADVIMQNKRTLYRTIKEKPGLSSNAVSDLVDIRKETVLKLLKTMRTDNALKSTRGERNADLWNVVDNEENNSKYYK